MLVKICGLSSIEEISAAAQADFIGSVVFSPKSHRNIPVEKVETLIKHAQGEFVLVTSEATKDQVISMDQLGADIIQLHGTARKLRRYIRNAKVALAIEKEELSRTIDYANLAYIVVDTNQNGYGGTGEKWEWETLPNPPIPILVAGGISIQNYKQALEATGADGIDLSSSLEIHGRKSLKKITQFLEVLEHDR